MIEAKDLRIGNWVIDRYTLSGDERFTKVVATYWADGYGSINASTDQDYYPIPLTKDILEKCGFEKDTHPPQDIWSNDFIIIFLMKNLDFILVIGKIIL